MFSFNIAVSPSVSYCSNSLLDGKLSSTQELRAYEKLNIRILQHNTISNNIKFRFFLIHISTYLHFEIRSCLEKMWGIKYYRTRCTLYQF